MQPKVLVFEYQLRAKRVDGQLTFELSNEELDDLFLGFDWKTPINSYSGRTKFYWGFSISGHGEEAMPVIEARMEASVQSLAEPAFLLEMAVTPSKIDTEQKQRLLRATKLLLKRSEFRIWWDHDVRGSRKRSNKAKLKLWEELNRQKDYAGEDDLRLEDVKVSVGDALEFFGFERKAKARDVKTQFSPKLKEMQLRYHPDSETGNEETFLHMQRCRSILEKWMKKR